MKVIFFESVKKGVNSNYVSLMMYTFHRTKNNNISIVSLYWQQWNISPAVVAGLFKQAWLNELPLTLVTAYFQLTMLS